jgi:hypothetical protein
MNLNSYFILQEHDTAQKWLKLLTGGSGGYVPRSRLPFPLLTLNPFVFFNFLVPLIRQPLSMMKYSKRT